MTPWVEVPFEKLILESRDGEWGEGSAKVGHQLCEIIRGTDFSSLYEAKKELPKRWIPDHLIARKGLQVGDILLETAGGTAKQPTGRSALLKPSFFAVHKNMPVLCASFARHLRLDTTSYSPDFIFYLLQALYDAGYMAVFNLQHTGVSRFQFTSFKKQTSINVPDLAIQQKISAILTAYDDLIENNRRRIVLLEKMAEEIYREWFVRLRFPGHENAKFEKGLPKGWEVQKVGQLFNTSSGGTPSRASAANYGGEVCWAKTGELKSTFVLETDEKLTRQGLDNSAAKIYPRHTVVIAMYCAMPDISILGTESATNQACCAFFPKRAYYHFSYVYLLIKFAQREMINLAHGAAQQNLSQELIKGFPLIVPNEEVVVLFSKFVAPMFENIESRMRQTDKLEKLRDALLPRLISGKLSVDALDIHFPPSMQLE